MTPEMRRLRGELVTRRDMLLNLQIANREASRNGQKDRNIEAAAMAIAANELKRTIDLIDRNYDKGGG